VSHDDLPNLASERLGAVALFASDDFFASKENLVRDQAPAWRENEYTDRGKWMDGWESRRKREIGRDVHDDVIVRLAMRGVVRLIVVDTAFFRGNFPEACSIEGSTAPEGTLVANLQSGEWTEIIPRSPLRGDERNVFEPASPVAFTHLRMRIFPDGGVARLRVHGVPTPDWPRLGGASGVLDLASLEAGASVLSCSDMFFGPKHNLIQPGRARNMSDGWETKRRRGIDAETHDWVLVELAGQGIIDRLELDTAFFLGNYPDTALVEGCDGDPNALDKPSFRTLLARRKLMGHTRHVFAHELDDRGPFTHLRLKVFPDGGVSRMRAFGTLTVTGRDDAAARFLATVLPGEAAKHLHACCASKRFAETMTRERPFDAGGAALFARARAVVTSLEERDLLEAMSAHPRIGAVDGGAYAERFSAGEQARARAAPPAVLAELQEANRAYESKHGFVFLICATGKSAEEVLATSRARLANARDAELGNAAAELAAITILRLRKLVGG
jgi:allantoicase